MSATPRICVWDLPLRVFHWSLLAAVATAIGSGWVGGDWMTVHGRAGLAIIGLLAFRLAWGFLGSTHARFAHFAPTPLRLLQHIRGQWHGVGHNPFGALSVFALLGLLAAQATLGLFSNDDIAYSGPWAPWVDTELSERLTAWHRRGANWTYGLIGLHLLAIGVYSLVKKHRLIAPMLTGWKTGEPEQAAQGGGKPALLFSIGLGLVASLLASGLVLRP